MRQSTGSMGIADQFDQRRDQQMRFKTVWVLCAIVVAIGSWIGIASSIEGTTVQIGAEELVDSLNPFTSVTGTYGAIAGAVWDGLYMTAQVDGEMLPVPNLAKDVVVSEDGLEYIVHLRRDAVFHDGVSLTAYDAEFTFNYILDNHLRKEMYLWPFASIKAIDDYILKMVLKERIDRRFLEFNAFATIGILPMHIWKDISADEAVGDIPIDKLIGSGPLRWTEFVPEDFIRLVFPDWTPEMDVAQQIIVKMFPTSAGIAEALINGEIDLAISISANVVKTLESIPSISIKQGRSTQIDDILINSYPLAYQRGDVSHPHPALEDRRVKQAMVLALNRPLIAELVYSGLAQPGCGLLPRWAYGDFVNPSLECTFDLDQANAILDEAGYVDTDGDGIRETASGLPLEFDYWTGFDRHIDTGEIWARDLKKIGIQLNVSFMDFGTLWEHMPMAWDYDIAAWMWVGDNVDPNFMLSVFTSGQVCADCWSDCGYMNPDYDALYERQLRASSYEERRAIVWEMQKKISEDNPTIAVAFVPHLDAWRNDRVKGDFEAGDPVTGLLTRNVLVTLDRLD